MREWNAHTNTTRSVVPHYYIFVDSLIAATTSTINDFFYYYSYMNFVQRLVTRARNLLFYRFWLLYRKHIVLVVTYMFSCIVLMCLFAFEALLGVCVCVCENVVHTDQCRILSLPLFLPRSFSLLVCSFLFVLRYTLRLPESRQTAAMFVYALCLYALHNGHSLCLCVCASYRYIIHIYEVNKSIEVLDCEHSVASDASHNSHGMESAFSAHGSHSIRTYHMYSLSLWMCVFVYVFSVCVHAFVICVCFEFEYMLPSPPLPLPLLLSSSLQQQQQQHFRASFNLNVINILFNVNGDKFLNSILVTLCVCFHHSFAVVLHRSIERERKRIRNTREFATNDTYHLF